MNLFVKTLFQINDLVYVVQSNSIDAFVSKQPQKIIKVFCDITYDEAGQHKTVRYLLGNGNLVAERKCFSQLHQADEYIKKFYN